MPVKKLSLVISLLGTAALTGCAGNSEQTSISAQLNETTPASMTLVGRFADGQELDEGMAEIVDFHKGSNSILVINSRDSTVDILNASALPDSAIKKPKSSSNIDRRYQLNVASDIRSIKVGGINSVAVSGNLMAVAVQNEIKTKPGVIAFYTLNNSGKARLSERSDCWCTAR